MKKTLAELTAIQFIDLICGDSSVLLGKHEVPNSFAIATATRNIIVEYKSIADPTAMKNYLYHTEETLKARIRILLFSMCNTLIFLNALDQVRDVLSEYGMSVSSMNKKRLTREVKSQLAKAKYDLERIESEDSSTDAPEPSEIRMSFDKQTAAMMAHFKFQIDVMTMQATLYAHLVERFSAEIKAQANALKIK